MVAQRTLNPWAVGSSPTRPIFRKASMKTAHQARLESLKYKVKATESLSLECIRSIERRVEESISLGYFEAPVDMYTSEAIDHFIKLEYAFRTNIHGVLMINWDSR